MKKIELLAPAGNYEALVAAVESGADAVYLGGSKFNARAFADNFDNDTLAKAVSYAHIRGVKVYVTVNILISDREMESALEYMNFLYSIDVDAVIVQDIAMIKLIRSIFPDMEVHCSTQMTIHNVDGAKYYQELGVSRIVLARELSIEDTKHIIENIEIEVESFVHGALCVCYSGQCYMSSLIGGRSGNRGRCAQPCRKKYSFYDMDSKKVLGQLENKHILSTRDLNTYGQLEKIVSSGIKSLKIEGRMKRPEYVSIVVSSYRRAIDSLLEGKKDWIDKNAEYELESAFNREFTQGYLFGRRNKDIVSINRPDNRGIFIGKAVKQQGNILTVSVQNNYINDGDGIEIIGKGGKSTGAVISGIKVNGRTTKRAVKGDSMNIFIKDRIEPGAVVNKTMDSELFKKAREEYYYENRKKIHLKCSVAIVKEEYPSITLEDFEGNTVSYTGSEKIAEAEKAQATVEKISEQLSKTGDTPYIFDNIAVKLGENCFVPVKTINNLRREALNLLDKERADRYNRSKLFFIPETIIKNNSVIEGIKENAILEYIAGVRDFESAKAAAEAGVDTIYLLKDCDSSQIIKLCKQSNRKCLFVLPSIIKDSEISFYEKIIKESPFDGIVISNSGQAALVKRLGCKTMRANYTLNIFNSAAAKHYYEQGLESLGLSTEINLPQIKGIRDNIGPQLEALVYGYMPVMTTEYCPIAMLEKEDSCRRLCSTAKLGLIDEKGMIFPIIKGGNCRTQLLNSNVIFTAEEIHSIIDSGVSKLRMDFYNETPKEIADTINLYKNFKNIDKDIRDNIIERIRNKGFTKGHFFRGVD